MGGRGCEKGKKKYKTQPAFGTQKNEKTKGNLRKNAVFEVIILETREFLRCGNPRQSKALVQMDMDHQRSQILHPAEDRLQLVVTLVAPGGFGVAGCWLGWKKRD